MNYLQTLNSLTGQITVHVTGKLLLGFSGWLSAWVFKLSCDDAGEGASMTEQFEQATQGEQIEQGECDDADRGEVDSGQRQ